MDKKNVVIIGVGALGSHLVQFIRNLDIELSVVDLDKVEQKNTQSQFHAKNAVGKPKTLALTQLMKFLFKIDIKGVPHKLVENNAEQLLGKADLIVDCLDNFEARNIVQQYVRKNKIPCVHGALAADGTFGRVVWDNYFTIDKEPSSGAATCENGEHLPFIALSAAIMAQSVKNWLDKGTQTNYNVSPSGVTRF